MLSQPFSRSTAIFRMPGDSAPSLVALPLAVPFPAKCAKCDCLNSGVQSKAVCMLRTLVRDKGNLVAEAGDWLRRMQKSLDQMNVRVHRAVADLQGTTGMAMVQAIVEGERDPRKLAKLRDHRCHKSEAAIAEQLSGHWREDHLFSLRQALKMYHSILERISDYEQELLKKLAAMERA